MFLQLHAGSGVNGLLLGAALLADDSRAALALVLADEHGVELFAADLAPVFVFVHSADWIFIMAKLAIFMVVDKNMHQ